jgi:polysaccharide deacetylase family protein (PEP-CTERM system associated)
MVQKVKQYPSVFSIDVEDGISLVMRDVFKKPIEQTDRVLRTTREILDLLERKQVTATFFTLGIVGVKFPQLVKEIVNKGHELAVHGHNHLMFFQMTPQKALEELSIAKDILEQLSGKAIYGHRAPAFSISKQTPWAFDILIEAGFTYDSSIMPVQSKFYGWQDFPQEITTIKTPNGCITEFPMSIISLLGKQLPFSGGSYLRLLPKTIIKKALKIVVSKKPAVIYVHPYEFDKEKYPNFYFDEIKKKDLKTQLKLKTNFINRKKSINKLAEIFDEFDFKAMLQIIEDTQISSEFQIK